MLQSHCTGGPSRRLRRASVAPVERILDGTGRLRILLPPPRSHPGRPGCSGAEPVIIPGEHFPKDPDSSRVFPVSFRCPPDVLPVFPDEPGPLRSRAGVFQEDPGCRCITEPPRAHRGRRGVLFIFLGNGLYFYIANSIHITSNLFAQQLTFCGKMACIYMY